MLIVQNNLLIYFIPELIFDTYRSACMGLEGWDIPEAAYVSRLCLLNFIVLPKKYSKDWHIRSSGCHLLCSKGPLSCKSSRPSVSGGNGSGLKRGCGAK
jgi:hypothetical protein